MCASVMAFSYIRSTFCNITSSTICYTDKLTFLHSTFCSEICSIDFNAPLHDDSSSSLLNLNFLLPNAYHNIQIIGSCRGFLFLNCCQSLWLWNPSSGSHKRISCSSIESNINAMFFTFLYGFGYDSSTDDHLVVNASYNPISPYCATRMEFFSLRDNSWRDVESSHLSYMNSSHGIRAGCLLNGVIHWFAFVAFDLTEKRFSEIPLPVDFEYNDFDHCDLGVLGEFLSLSAILWNYPVEIWVMEEYKVQSSWTKAIVVFVENIPSQCFSRICSTRGSDIAGMEGSTGLIKVMTRVCCKNIIMVHISLRLLCIQSSYFHGRIKSFFYEMTTFSLRPLLSC